MTAASHMDRQYLATALGVERKAYGADNGIRIRNLVFIICHLELGYWDLVFVTWNLFLGTWFLGLGIWYLSFGT